MKKQLHTLFGMIAALFLFVGGAYLPDPVAGPLIMLGALALFAKNLLELLIK